MHSEVGRAMPFVALESAYLNGDRPSFENPVPDVKQTHSTVPVGLCLLIEKGLSVDIIAHGTGMVFHVINLVVMVLMPMVVIHVKDSGFSLDTRLCVQKGRAEALKDTVGLGRDEWGRLGQRNARVNQIRVSPKSPSYDRRGKLDVEDCSLEYLYIYGSCEGLQIFIEVAPRLKIVVCDNQRDVEEAANIRTLPLWERKERE
ncbi:hypothetical protein G5I_11842 [Acromyrmex echinatior]|uniref:Uncharacterized protein n=1 Tax=Acromyrmex echinatior TaxID=103372 RepID=F4X0Q9_ACREC|nr:hypothetical protein G5I_11842 [Acromyrmex echinatior]